MASSNGWTMVVFLLVVSQLVLYSHHSSGLSFEELTRKHDPVIPFEVREAGNVTVARSQTEGMLAYGVWTIIIINN